MYKNFRVGGGIVLGLSALVLGLVGCSTTILRDSDNNIKKAISNSTDIKANGKVYEYVDKGSIVSGKEYLLVGEIGNKRYIATDYQKNNIYATEYTENGDYVAFKIEEVTDSEKTYTFYDENSNAYLYAAGGNSSNYLKKTTTLNGKAKWTLDAKNNFKCIDSTVARNTIFFNENKGSPIISCYKNDSTGYSEVYLFKEKEISSSEKIKNIVLSNSLSFNYKYTTLNDIESKSITIASGKNCNEDNDEYKLDTDFTSYNSGDYLTKFENSGLNTYVTYEFKQSISNFSLGFNYKCNGNGSFDGKVIISAFNSKGIQFDEEKTFSTDKEEGVFETSSFNEIGDIVKVTISYEKTSGNLATGDITLNYQTNARNYTSFSDVKVIVGYKLFESPESISEIGIITSAKSDFSGLNDGDAIPTDLATSKIKKFTNSNKTVAYYVGVTYTDEEVKNNFNSEVKYQVYAIENGKTLFGTLYTTTLAEQFNKIENAKMSTSFKDYFKIA